MLWQGSEVDQRYAICGRVADTKPAQSRGFVTSSVRRGPASAAQGRADPAEAHNHQSPRLRLRNRKSSIDHCGRNGAVGLGSNARIFRAAALVHDLKVTATSALGGYGTRDVVSRAKLSFTTKGRPSAPNGEVGSEFTLEPTDSIGQLVATASSRTFRYSFLVEPHGRDMNVGVQGIFVHRRIAAEGSRTAFRRFLSSATA